MYPNKLMKYLECDEIDPWFEEHVIQQIDEEFVQYWVKFYGKPREYEEIECANPSADYFMKMGFFFFGWKARGMKEKGEWYGATD